MSITIDCKERGLIELFSQAGLQHHASTLAVGDVLCEYEDSAWVCERKRFDDFAASIQDGRWREQTSRLFASGCQVVFIFEGDFRSTGMYNSLIGAWVNSELRHCYTFRTLDLDETFVVLRDLVEKLARRPARVAFGGLALPRLTSKRKRDEEVRVCWIRQLMCVPTVSEHVAGKLLDYFGSLTAIQEALREPKQFPAIQLSEKSRLGKARISKLVKYLA